MASSPVCAALKRAGARRSKVVALLQTFEIVWHLYVCVCACRGGERRLWREIHHGQLPGQGVQAKESVRALVAR